MDQETITDKSLQVLIPQAQATVPDFTLAGWIIMEVPFNRNIGAGKKFKYNNRYFIAVITNIESDTVSYLLNACKRYMPHLC